MQKKRKPLHLILRVMKFTAIQLFVAILTLTCLQAKDSNAQEILDKKISLEANDLTLAKVLDKIEKQVEVKFTYSQEKISTKERVTFEFKEATMKMVLDEIFTPFAIDYKVFNDRTIVLTKLKMTTSELPPITGKVTDENDEPLIGATVTVKGTGDGTVTDENGRFQLDAPSGSTLVFSYTGFAPKEVVVGVSTVINVKLQSGRELDEVVVVGYGVQRRSDVTGSIASLSTEDFEAQPVQFTRQALQGRTAGVQVSNTSGAPGNTGVIKIRGVNSITNSGAPLVVIDGVIGASLPSIHPSDIESIEVLKDASATALYGSRGANGVILVTTKRASGKTVVTASANFSFQALPKTIDLLDGAQFAQAINTSRGQELFSQQEIEELQANGGTDWQDEIFRSGADAMIQNYHVAASGKEGKIGYYLAGNIIDNEGILLNSRYERKSLRANITADVSDKLSIGTIFQYSDELARNAFTGSSPLFSPVAASLFFSPASPIFDENGEIIKTTPFSLATNPLGQAEGRIQDIFTDNTTINFNLNYEIVNGLTYTFRFANSSVKTTTGNFSDDNVSNVPASASVFNNKFSRFQHTHILGWDKDLSEDHRISVKGIFEETADENFGSTASAAELTNLTGLYFNLAFGTQTASSGQNNTDIRSYLGRLDYAFMDKLLLTATFRADGSSKFLGDNKWGYFPSVAVGYVVTKESFLEDNEVLTNLKLRGSWGQVGNEGIAPFSTIPSLNTAIANNPSLNGTSTVAGIAPGGLNNPDLRWETTTQIDLGFDAEFLAGRFNLSFDYYRKNTTDLLLARTLPPSFGPGSRLENVGEIENEGIEVVLDAIAINTKDFQWDVSFNISTANTVLVDIGDQEFLSVGGAFRSSADIVQQLFVGEEVGTIRGYQTLGVWGTDETTEAANFGAVPGDIKYADINDDGAITTDDITVIGNGAPDFIWGLNNTFNYKNFSLNVFFQSMVGQDILNYSRAVRSGASADGSITDIGLLDAWTPDNQNTDAPALTSTGFQQIESSRFIEDGTFIRLKNISLAYTLPASLLTGIGVERVTVNVSGQNVFTITDYTGYDPEVNSGGASNTDIGFDTGVYPNPRAWTVGVNVTF
ncbi:MAG: TonB-dependent receptor [Bacteroidota bacterium]